MRASHVIAIALIAASFGLGGSRLAAQGITSFELPAEFPPASYKGRQYVDSRGCVFVRAGVDGNVTWVPRVARNRKTICGFQPSLGGRVAQAEPAEPKPAATALTVPAPKPAATPAPAPQPKPAPVIVARPAPSQAKTVSTPTTTIVATPKTVTTGNTTTTVTPKTVKVVTTAPQPMAKPAEMAPRASACRGASAVSGKYLTAPDGIAVRCGPQETAHVTVINGGNGRGPVKTAPAPAYTHSPAQPAPLPRATAVVTATPTTRVVPRHVYEAQKVSTQGVYIPEGYKSVWEDDRLNPKRAHQTFAGKAQMEVMWTNTVPRILVERRSGREVTYLYPGLQYPYTSFAEQDAARVTISTKGRAADHPQHQQAERVRHAKVQERSGTATVSTRSATVRTQAPAASHRYVKAGRFQDQGAAQRAAQKLANAGLPTMLGQGRSAGVVIVGPFRTQAQLTSALQRVRGMGFGGATLRR